MTVIPVDLLATGGKLLPPGGQVLTAEEMAMMAPKPKEKKEDTPAVAPVLDARCRYCGRDPKADPDHPSPDDLIDFAKSIWRDEPFSKTYDFYGGAISVSFRTLTADETETSQRAVLTDANNDQMVGPLGALAMMDRGEEYQFAMSISRIHLGEKRYDQPKEIEPRKTLAQVKAIVGGQVAYQTVRTAYRTFYSLTKKLIESGSDPSFWPATPPAGPSPVSPPPVTQA